MDLDSCDLNELTSHARTLFFKLDELFKQVGPLVEEIGVLRAELLTVEQELNKRNVKHL